MEDHKKKILRGGSKSKFMTKLEEAMKAKAKSPEEEK